MKQNHLSLGTIRIQIWNVQIVHVHKLIQSCKRRLTDSVIYGVTILIMVRHQPFCQPKGECRYTKKTKFYPHSPKTGGITQRWTEKLRFNIYPIP